MALIYVNGLRRGFWSTDTLDDRSSERFDITRWLARGDNELRLLVANTGGPAGFKARIWVDDELVLDASCSDAVCPSGSEVPSGLIFDETLTVTSDAFACPVPACVASAGEDGWLYLDGVYTGTRTPTQLLLPPGRYDIGVGLGTGDPSPDAAPDFVHEGRFRERSVVLEEPTSVELTTGDRIAPVHYDFLVVPIREVEYTNGQVATLAADVPERLREAIEFTSTTFVEPFTFGLVEFSAVLHPVLETTVSADDDGFVPISLGALEAAGLDLAEVERHAVTVWAYSAHLGDGAEVDEPPCCAWGDGHQDQVWIHSGWTLAEPIVYHVLIHEWLHTIEDNLRSYGYGGADGVHGDDEHGYDSDVDGENRFVRFYRHFIRGRLREAGLHVGAVIDLWQSPPGSGDRASRRHSGVGVHVLARAPDDLR